MKHSVHRESAFAQCEWRNGKACIEACDVHHGKPNHASKIQFELNTGERLKLCAALFGRKLNGGGNRVDKRWRLTWLGDVGDQVCQLKMKNSAVQVDIYLNSDDRLWWAMLLVRSIAHDLEASVQDILAMIREGYRFEVIQPRPERA